MSHSSDIIIAGLGAMGSATLYELAQRGYDVVGFDRFAPPHTLGSSHGKSRIIREAYFEDPRYVPLVQRAYQRWHELEEESGTHLFRRTGGLMLGTRDSALVTGALRSAGLHSLPHEILSADEIRHEMPAFHPTHDTVGVWEPNAGILAPEAAITTALDLAEQHSARVHLNEPLRSWKATPGGVEVVTDHATYHAHKLILSAGAWLGDTVKELNLPLVVQRNVIYWFKPDGNPASLSAEHCPVFVWEHAPKEVWYGLPDTGDGFKVGRHHHGMSYHPEDVPREILPAEIAEVRDLMRRFIPDGDSAPVDAVACLYTNTPDGHFILDRHPAHANVIIASVCSGHGFKFASAIGEVLADMVTDAPPAFDLAPFGLARFG